MIQRKSQGKAFYKRYFSCYTILFFILYGAMYLIFKGNGKSFLWDCDGTNQHYPALYYMGNYFKSLISGLFGGTAEPVGMVDFRLGQGMDVLTTLNYYGFGDPLNLLAALVPQAQMEGLYTFLICLRLYLAGAAFSAYCFTIRKRDAGAVLLGAITYTFSGMLLFAGVRHPFFINACIYLPLLLIAAERMLTKKKYGFFAFMVGLSLISNFYFAYMNTALVGIYLLFRIFGMQEGTIPEKLLTILKMCMAYLWGVLLSAVVFLPVVYAFLQNARTGDVAGYTDSLLYYDADYYKNYIRNYISPNIWVGSWTIVSMASVCLPALALFLKEKGKKRGRIRMLKGIFFTLFLFTLIPLFGKLFNGNGYVCNRWMYAFAMVNAMILVVMASKLLTLAKKDRIFVGVVCTIYLVISIIVTEKQQEMTWIGAGCLLATVAVIFYINRRPSLTKNQGYMYLTGITTVTILAYMAAIYLPSLGKYVENFCDSNGAYSYQESSPVQAMSAIEDTDFYRVEQPWLMSNQASVLNYNGNTFYWSIVPATTTKYYDALALSALDRTFECNGQDARTIVNELSSTKYYVTESTKTGCVPYGYEFVTSVPREDGTVDNVYQNTYALSIGYGYDSYIEESKYELLEPLQKQEILMSAAVLSDEDARKAKEAGVKELQIEDLYLFTHPIEVKLGTLDGITMSGTSFEVTKKDATMELTFEGEENSETYLVIKNFKAVKGTDYNKLTITSAFGSETTMFLYNPVNAAHYDKEYQGVNLGYSKEKKNSLTITFPSKGTFSYEELTMYSYTMDVYEAQAQAFVDSGLSDVTVTGNTVTGTVTAEETKWMQFSIPYSKGWKAYVDGEEVALSPSNIAYMGLAVSEGTHKIRLQYETPWIKVGGILSVLAAITLVGAYVAGRRKKGKHE